MIKPTLIAGLLVAANALGTSVQTPRITAANTSTSSSPTAAAADVSGLPLVELPARSHGRAAGADTFVVMISGDGGWAGLDRAVAEQLGTRGFAVVGWDSLRYFWTERTPDTAAQDLDRVIRHYASAWRRPRVLLVGYSQGADVLPFMVNRLPAATRNAIAGSALVAIGTNASFKVSVKNWIGTPPRSRPLAPEIADARLGRLVCIYGTDDKDAGCTQFTAPGMHTIELPGGHHFDGDYAKVTAAVLTALRS